MRDFLKLRVGCHNIEGLNQKLDNTDLFEYIKEFHIYRLFWKHGDLAKMKLYLKISMS